MNSKKGFSLMEIPSLAMTFGIIAIVLGLVATILVQVQATQDVGSVAYNITQDGLESQKTLSSWQGTWVVIAAAAVVLGLISAYLFFRQG